MLLTAFSLGSAGLAAWVGLRDTGVPRPSDSYLSTVLHGLRPATVRANPSAVDRKRNETILAHCTAPFRLLRRPRLLTHFESGKGVSV